MVCGPPRLTATICAYSISSATQQTAIQIKIAGEEHVGKPAQRVSLPTRTARRGLSQVDFGDGDVIPKSRCVLKGNSIRKIHLMTEVLV